MTMEKTNIAKFITSKMARRKRFERVVGLLTNDSAIFLLAFICVSTLFLRKFELNQIVNMGSVDMKSYPEL